MNPLTAVVYMNVCMLTMFKTIESLDAVYLRLTLVTQQYSHSNKSSKNELLLFRYSFKTLIDWSNEESSIA